MAQKLNKKLVFVVGSLLILLVIGGAGTLVLRYRYDADRHVRAGDEYVSAGDYRKAADAYGRAVAKKPTNLAYLEKFKTAILALTPETDNEARERYGQYLQVLSNEARSARDDMARWRTYLETFRAQAEAINAQAMWKGLGDRCEDMLKIVPEQGVGQALGKLYLGYSGFRRIDGLNDSERVAMVKDLEAALQSKELTPAERDLAVGSLARMTVRDAAVAGGAGRADKIDSANEAMKKAFERAETETPNGLCTTIAKLERAIVVSKGNVSDPSVVAATEALAKVAAASAQGLDVLECAASLARAGNAGVEEAQSLLSTYVEKHPDELLHRRALGLAMRSVDPKTARRELDFVLKAPRPTTGLLAASYEGNRISAAQALFDIAFDQAERGGDAEKAAHIKEAVAARDVLEKMLAGATDNSTIIRADAKLAILNGDMTGALVKFNEVFKKGSQIDLELYVLTALANLRVGEVGQARNLVNTGLTLSPGNPVLLKLRARLDLATARSREAIATLRGVVDMTPDDEEAKQLLAAAINAQEADPTNISAGDPFIELAGRVQAFLETKEFDRARALLSEFRQKLTAPDVRLERIAIALEVQADQPQVALKMTKDALAKFPADAALIRYNAVLASDDPAERIIALSEGSVTDPKELAVLTYLRLEQTGQTVRQQAERERRLGVASAATTAMNADKLAAAAAQWRAKAQQLDPTHPALIESDFTLALEKKDYAAAETLAKLADESSRDRTLGPSCHSRILLAQDKVAEATQVLERAIQSGVDASTIYRSLGAANERSGNVEIAMRNYEEAYKRRPGDMQTVRLLVGASIRAGNTQRALEVLREARQLAGFDEEVGNTWLALEQQVGDRRMAMRMRENQYRVAPTNIENAQTLAGILAMTAPEREDIVGDNARPLFNETQWSAMDIASRTRELDRVRGDWRKRAQDIYTQILSRDPANIDSANSYAGMLRALGQVAEAEAVLKAAVDKAGPDAGWRGMVMLGQFQNVTGGKDRARQSFAEAVRREDPKTRPATRAIIDTSMSIERYDMAIEYLEPLVKVDDNPTLKLTLAECYLRANRLDDARKSFDAGAGTGTREMGTELLDGAIQAARGDALRASGDIAGAKAAYDAAIAAYGRAKKLGPSMPQPFIQDSMAKRKVFELTGDRASGEEALAAADRGAALGATFFPACQNRAEVLLALGDGAGAAAEYERYLRLLPTSVEARRRLVELLYNNQNLDRAEETLRAAIGYSPGEPSWHYTLADLMARRGRYKDAAVSFARADKLRPDATTFFRQVDALIHDKDFNGAIDACRVRADLMTSNPVARAYLGVALLGKGERGDGVASLKESFRDVKKALDAGDPNMAEAWYGAVRLVFPPTMMSDAEKLVADVEGADMSPAAREFLSSLALGQGPDGLQKVLALLTPIEAADYSKNPGFGAMVLDRLGTTYYLLKQCEKAVPAFEKAVALTPRNDAVLNNFAYLCVDCLKDAKKALPAARMAVQLQPTRGEYLDTLAYALLADGQGAAALEAADRAAKLGDSAAIQLHRAQAFKLLDRLPQARETANRALGMQPDDATKTSIEQLLSSLK